MFHYKHKKKGLKTTHIARASNQRCPPLHQTQCDKKVKLLLTTIIVIYHKYNNYSLPQTIGSMKCLPTPPTPHAYHYYHSTAPIPPITPFTLPPPLNPTPLQTTQLTYPTHPPLSAQHPTPQNPPTLPLPTSPTPTFTVPSQLKSSL